MKRTETFKRDNLLVEYLLEHKGRENAVTRHQVAQFLTENGYNQNADTVHGIIERIIKERHLPICSVNCKGYFWAKSKSDILGCINEHKSRINAHTERIKFLESFIME